MGAPMMYSSGTTGRPKGILRPMFDIHPSETSIGVLGIAGLWRLREGMVYLSPAPLYHTAPQVSVAIALRMQVDGGRDGALRPGAVSRARGAATGSHTRRSSRPCSAACSSCPTTVRCGGRRVVAGGRHPRCRAVPGAGEGADDRVVRADPARVLRGDRGQRVHVHRPRRTGWRTRAASGGAVLSDIQILDDDGGRARWGLRGRCGSPGPPTSSTSTTPRRRPVVGGTTATTRRWATSGIWTPRGTCS